MTTTSSEHDQSLKETLAGGGNNDNIDTIVNTQEVPSGGSTMQCAENGSTSNNKDDIFRRLDKRKENLEEQRSLHVKERARNLAENQSLLNKLYEMSEKILKSIDNASDAHARKPSEDYSDLINSLSKDIQMFDTFFKEKSPDLSPYDIRTTQAAAIEIKEKFVQLQDRLRPKKKFGFKSKAKKSANTSAEPGKDRKENEHSNYPSKGNKSEHIASHQSDDGSYIVKRSFQQQDNVIEVPGDDILGRDVIIDGLCSSNPCEKLTVKIFGSPGTVHATNLKNVVLLCGPVQTSVFVENCADCDFAVACQQLRTHSTTNSSFYLHVTSKGIVEDCHSVQFAPYNLSYPNIDENFIASGLNKNVNHWSEIDDFNWLSKEKPSPNWNILPEAKRKTNW